MKIAPSLLASNFAELGKEVERVSKAGADYIHLDVMDGIFVQNITFGADVIKSIRPYSNLPFDVHLMIVNPIRYIQNFINAGSDIITIHIESGKNVEKFLKLIKSMGKKAGLAINPDTPASEIFELIGLIDVVLVMTVYPGFGGQKFIVKMLEKVEAIKNEIVKKGLKTLIEVDGGINQETVKIAKSAGVDICVAGTSVFRSNDMRSSIYSLKI